MKQLVFPLALAAAALCARTPLGAQAYTLDFGTGPAAPNICTSATTGIGPLIACGNFGYISQSYGDVAGVVNVAYTDVSALGVPTGGSLRWWADNYNNLYGVLWGSESWAWIDLLPAAGKTITLNGFLMGAYPNATNTTNIAISGIGSGTPLYSFTGPIGTGSTASTPFTFGSGLSSASGIRIEWKFDAFNVGIDNINFTVSNTSTPPSVVPEPGTWALMLTGLGMLGVVARRRRV